MPHCLVLNYAVYAYLRSQNTKTNIMAKKILIVDDEPDILEILSFNLEMEGYEVFTAEGADEAQKIVNRQSGSGIDLILLDVMMTAKSGFEWARELKADKQTADIPIIFCTAKTAEDDLVAGFDLGSDDYICKPFRISEVKARVRAVLRRSGISSTPATDNRDGEKTGLHLDHDRKECYVDGEVVTFTKLEFEVLALLLGSPGQIFSRDKILNTVWPNDAIVLDRTVDVNITRIRKKIGKYGECIRTKFGYGYYYDAYDK